MAAPRLRPEDLPVEFAIFPLTGALLLPHGKLPLNIFEKRYLAMVDDCMAAGRMLGMIQPNPTQPQTERGSTIYHVGCLGRLSSFSETDDGRYLITLTGVMRFAVAEELAMVRGYRRVRGDFSAYRIDSEADMGGFELDREDLFSSLRAYFHRRGFDANWDAIREMPDDMLIVTLCMACPFEAAEKQALLEAPLPADRVAALLALLQIDRHSSGDPQRDGASPGRRVS
jgi:Lon protease-like protein